MADNLNRASSVTILSPKAGMKIIPGACIVKGTSAAHAIVDARVNGEPFALITADENGRWDYVLHLEKPGYYMLGAQTVDAEALPIIAHIVAPMTKIGIGEHTLHIQNLSYRPSSVSKAIAASELRRHYNWKWIVLTLVALLFITILVFGRFAPGVMDRFAAIPGMDRLLTMPGFNRTLSRMETPPTIIPLSGEAEVELGSLGLGGTGMPNSNLALSLNGNVVGTMQVSDSGTWQQNIELTELGNNELVATMLDANGNPTLSSSVYTLEVVDVITAAADELAKESEPTQSPESMEATVSETLQPTESNLVGEPMTEEPVAEDSEQLADGKPTEEAEQEPEQFAESEPTEEALQEPDPTRQSPNEPSVTTPSKIYMPSGPIEAGAFNINGTAPAGMIVELLVNGESIGTSKADDAGNWTIAADFLEAGEYALALNTSNESAVIGSMSDNYSLSVIISTVNEVGDSASADMDAAQSLSGNPLGNPSDDSPDSGSVAGIDTVITANIPASAVNTGVFSLNGRAPVAASITVTLDSQPIAATYADGNGIWSTPITVTIAGEYVVQASAADRSGLLLGYSNPATLAVVGETTASGAEMLDPLAETAPTQLPSTATKVPLILTAISPTSTQVPPVATDVPSTATQVPLILTAVSPTSTQVLPTATQVPPVATQIPPIATQVPPTAQTQQSFLQQPTISIVPDTVDIGLFTLTGTAEPSTVLTLYLDRQRLDELIVDRDGGWQYKVRIAPGLHDVYASSLGTEYRLGSTSRLVEFTVSDPNDAGVVNLQSVEGGTGMSNLRIETASPPTVRFLREAGLFEMVGNGIPNSSIQIIIDGVATDLVVVNEDGTWGPYSFTLNSGLHELNIYDLRPDGSVEYIGVPISLNVP